MASNISQRLQAILGKDVDFVAQGESKTFVVEVQRKALKPIVVTAGVVVAISSLLIWLNRPQPMVMPTIATSGSPVTLASPSARPSAILVDVEGKVRHPGLQRLTIGARVADAIEAAGGLLRGVQHANVNLAAPVSDGQLIVVGLPGIVMNGASGVSGSVDGSGNTTININTATEAQFESLPGVGPVLASRLVQWRQTHGQFSSINALQDVPGIGPKVFDNLRTYVSVS